MNTTPADPETRPDAAPPAERAVWTALRTVEDPELPVSVVDLGLIYDVEVSEGRATIEITLTYSGCPAREMIVGDVEAAARSVRGIEGVDVELVYSPAWSYERITEQGRQDLTEHGLAVPGEDSKPDPSCYP